MNPRRNVLSEAELEPVKRRTRPRKLRSTDAAKANPVAEMQAGLEVLIQQDERHASRHSARLCLSGLLLLSAVFWLSIAHAIGLFRF